MGLVLTVFSHFLDTHPPILIVMVYGTGPYPPPPPPHELLATEMYKLSKGLAPKIMEDLFPSREINYNI